MINFLIQYSLTLVIPSEQLGSLQSKKCHSDEAEFHAYAFVSGLSAIDKSARPVLTLTVSYQAKRLQFVHARYPIHLTEILY